MVNYYLSWLENWTVSLSINRGAFVQLHTRITGPFGVTNQRES